MNPRRLVFEATFGEDELVPPKFPSSSKVGIKEDRKEAVAGLTLAEEPC